MTHARKLQDSHDLLYSHQVHADGGGAEAARSVVASGHPEGKTLVRVRVRV